MHCDHHDKYELGLTDYVDHSNMIFLVFQVCQWETKAR